MASQSQRQKEAYSRAGVTAAYGTQTMQSTTELIKQSIDIVDIVGEVVDLRRGGAHYKGMCPFHDNTRTPAFVVFPDSQSWRCFGVCNEGGDVFSFLMKQRGWGFREALEHLAERCGVQLQHPDERRAEQENRLRSALEEAERYYHKILLSGDEARLARRYLRRRGLSGDIVRQFRLGYALPGWDNLKDYLQSQGYGEQELVDAGLLSESRETGKRYDRLRERVVFPIRDHRDRLVGFAGRAMGDVVPKYLNTPETWLFHKGSYLYGLNQVPAEAENIIVVEGYMDVLQGWQHGKHNLVSQMGTALTPQQIRLLRHRRSKQILLATDGDDAGREAIMKNAPPLLAEAQQYDIEVSVLSLPDGKDPDDLLLYDVGAWDELVASAKPVVEYAIQVTTADLAPTDVQAKVRAADWIASLIATLKSGVAKAHYRQMMAARLGVNPDDLPAGNPITPPEVAMSKPATQAPVSNLQQARFVWQCMSIPLLLHMVNDELTSVAQPVVSAGEFEQVEDRVIIERLASLQSDFGDVAERVEQLQSLPVQSQGERFDLPRRLAVSVLKWRQRQARADLDRLGCKMQRGDSSDESCELAQRLAELPLEIAQLIQAERQLLGHKKILSTR